MRSARFEAGCAALVAAALAAAGVGACTTTTDSLGWNGASGTTIHPLPRRDTYPNAFRDVLGKSDAEIAAKIAAVFAQLFHGDALTQAIYVPMDPDQAYIADVLHGDVRTEGVGYGMIIAVELDKRDEFDRLWRYAKAQMAFTDGPNRGYFLSRCEDGANVTNACVDPFGYEQFLTALLFANDRWTSTPAAGGLDYAGDAKLLLEVMRHKQDLNGGIVEGVTNTFDVPTALPFDVPHVSAAGESRPSVAMPAYYELWAQAAGDPFWSRAARASRAYWQRSAHPTTGLWPTRAAFDGTPVSGSDTYAAESYRAQLNLVLDQIWFGSDPWEQTQADRLLAFFTSQGLDKYCAIYSLEGTNCMDLSHPNALVAMNGATALIATSANRQMFIEAVWNMVPQTGLPRYYSGILQLLSLLVLGGQFRIW